MVALACAMGAAGAAQAQTAVPGIEVKATGAGPLALSTPVQTGSRLGLTPLQTPASVEVLSGDHIRARGDISLADAITRATGIVQQSDPGNGSTASFAARGFNGVGSVMVLYDGMRLFVGAGTVTFPFDPWTVERVEVLKGPSSVLYGQGAIGGAVNVVPKRASFGMPSYEFQVGGGSDRTYRVGVGVGAPLGDALAVRADVSRNGSNGYVDRGGSESWALSGSIAWKAAPNLTFTLSDDYGDQRPMRYFGAPLIDGAIQKARRELNYNVFDSIIRYRDNAGQLRTDWEPAEGIKVRNAAYILTTRRQWRNVEIYAFDAPASVTRSSYTPIKHDERQIGDTFDVSFASKLGAMDNTLLVGAEANRVRFVHTNDGFPDTESVVDAFDPVPGLFDEQGVFAPRYRTRTRQLGLFAEDQLKLTPELSLIGGLRHDRYRVKRQDLVNDLQVVDKTLRNTSWRLGAVYQPVPALSLYAQYATGADPLGSLITTSSSQAPFDLSTGRQYEAGVKGQLVGGRVEWTFAAFRIVKEKLLTRDRANPNQQIQVGQRSAKGLEASFAVQLAEGLSLDANGAVLDAEFDDFTEVVGGAPVSRNGLTPPNTPEKTANLWLSWQALPKLRLYGGARYVGRQYGDNANSANLVLPSYTVADAGVEWALTPHLTLNAQLFNALDNSYGYTAYGDEQWILGRPRAFEVRLNGRF
jgi:iron complex outermembrane receptor protein